MQPDEIERICIVRPSSDEREGCDYIEEILKTEGVYFYCTCEARDCDVSRWKRHPVIILLSGEYDEAVSEGLLAYLHQGGRVIALCPSGPFLRLLGVTQGQTLTDARVHVLADSQLPRCEEDLLCPGPISRSVAAEGKVLAEFRSQEGECVGPAILSISAGKGECVLFAYDPVRSVITLRHGDAGLDYDADDPVTSGLHGPRHIHAFRRLGKKYSRTVPIADVHQDVLREAVFHCFSDTGAVLPRIWHYPHAYPAMYFIKSDGCGEKGIDREIELAEQHDGKVTFCRLSSSSYGGELIRQWRDRGHGMSMETDIYPLTHYHNPPRTRMADFHEAAYSEIRAFVEKERSLFREQCGFDTETLSIHGSQWPGGRMAQILTDNGVVMGTHFCTHWPLSTKKGFGPYGVPTALPMRYYDFEKGTMEFFLQPSLYDESQAIGESEPDGVRRTGFTQQEYADQIIRFVTESAEKYHGTHVANFHPVYLDPHHPRTSHDAFIRILQAVRSMSIPSWDMESWCAFVRKRDAVKITKLSLKNGRTILGLMCPHDIDGLTMLIGKGPASPGAWLDGKQLPVSSAVFEGARQWYVICPLISGKEATMEIAGADP